MSRKRTTANLRKERLVRDLGWKCLRCGLEGADYSVYVFHHVFPKNKSFTICAGMGKEESEFEGVVVPEVHDKCALLCANCHLIINADKEEFGNLATKWMKKKKNQAKMNKYSEHGENVN